MKTFNFQDIQKWNPCIDIGKFLPKSWSGNAVDILKHPSEANVWQRIWVVLRPEVMTPEQIKEFKTWSNKRAYEILGTPGFIPHGRLFEDRNHMQNLDFEFEHLLNLVWEISDQNEQKNKLIEILSR